MILRHLDRAMSDAKADGSTRPRADSKLRGEGRKPRQ